MEADVFLNAYIDLNLLLAVGALFWLAVKWSVSRIGLERAFRPQLRMLNGLTVSLAVFPLIAFLVSTRMAANPANLSDLLVSQYLHGNVHMSASAFQDMMGLRESFVRDLAGLQTPWASLIWAAFASGMLICAVQATLSIVRLRNIISAAHVWKTSGRVKIMISDVTRVAFSTRGLRTRYVVLPTSVLNSSSDLRLTVSHELQHFRQKDVEFELLLELLRPLLFWNPVYYFWRREIRQLREYACDQSLMMRPHFNVRAYGECLIRASLSASRQPVLFEQKAPIVALIDRRSTRSRSLLKQRIVAIAAADNPQGHLFSWLVLGGILACAVFTSAMAMQRPADWSHDRIMLATIVNLERMNNREAEPQSAFQGGFVAAD